MTASGNLFTATARFSRTSFTGGGLEYIAHSIGGVVGTTNMILTVGASDHATAEYRNKLLGISINSPGGEHVLTIQRTNEGKDDESVDYLFDGEEREEKVFKS